MYVIVVLIFLGLRIIRSISKSLVIYRQSELIKAKTEWFRLQHLKRQKYLQSGQRTETLPHKKTKAH